jgi:hypothetical protein
LLYEFAQMVCGPAPLPQTLLYRVNPPLDQEAYWAEEDQTAASAWDAPRTSAVAAAITGTAIRRALNMRYSHRAKDDWVAVECLSNSVELFVEALRFLFDLIVTTSFETAT